MLIGAHVSSSGGLERALDRGRELDADVIQIFTQSPRTWRSPSHTAAELDAFRAAQQAETQVQATFCHATYLINLASPDLGLAERSRVCLAENLVAASAIGAAGMIVHVGSHRGEGFEPVIAAVAARLSSALDEAGDALGAATCPLLIENAAGAGGTVGRTFDEIAAIIEATDRDRRLGACLDTQHLFASGVSYRDATEADHVVLELDRTIGLDRLACIHLNDSKVALGSNRDRHENLGEGEIGAEALGLLVSHPLLDRVPAILEVPGSGRGPRGEDVTKARSILAGGLDQRRRTKRSPSR
ncbi:MAG: deoxyribonuclease IV [Acidimicrobiales bacterium]